MTYKANRKLNFSAQKSDINHHLTTVGMIEDIKSVWLLSWSRSIEQYVILIFDYGSFMAQ